MEEISTQLLYQRIRNRVIELMEMHSTFEGTLGAFSMLNMVDDWLPVPYENAPNVFSTKEKDAIADFLRLFEVAADATLVNTWDVEWFKNSPEWSALSKVAQEAYDIFMQRGRFSEDDEQALTLH